ncbi:MAG: hypothetical protein WAN11_09670 [Syntrophobacteraceae bacterium]
MNRQPETLAPDLNEVRVQRLTSDGSVNADLNAVRVHSQKIVPGLEALANRYDVKP